MPRPSLADDLPLRSRTSPAWALVALAQPVALLDDHAHLEKKAAVNALGLLQGCPHGATAEEATRWTRTLAGIARDEAEHLHLVLRVLAHRGGALSRTHRNPYAAALHGEVRSGDHELLDRLLVGGLIEARSCERFEALVAAGPDDELRALYGGLCASERGHHRAFLELARIVAPEAEVEARWDELLDRERAAIESQAAGPRMHSGAPTRE